MSKSSNNSGCAAIGMLALMVAVGYFVYQKNQAPENLKRANELYANGNQKEAVVIYEATFLFASDDDKRDSLPRIVEYHVSQNNTKDAEAWIRKGVERDLTVSYSDPAARGLADKLYRERESLKRAEAERKEAEAKAAKTRPTAKRKEEAWAAAENHVKKYLKFPLDADFAYADPTSNESGTFWQVASTVKAKNAFGAALTYSYNVNMRYDGENWELVYCKINDVVHFASDDLVRAAIAVNSDTSEPPPSNASESLRAKQQAYDEKRDAAREAVRLNERETARKNRPAIAANDLRLAKEALALGDKAAYERTLRRVIETYPETDAGQEAKNLLGEK